MGSIGQQTLFSSLEPVPYDEAVVVKAAVEADAHPDKVSLGLGVYRDDQARPWTLPSVKQPCFEAILKLPDNHDYVPAGGLPRYVESAQKLLFGPIIDAVADRLASVQTISGSGALHLGAVFLSKTTKPKNIWISDPSWISHPIIWELTVPEVQRKFYPYFDPVTKGVDFDGMIKALEGAEKGDVVLLQACAHNPTGCDPSKEQWKDIANVCERRELIPFFDIAYQGFATGDVDEDAWALRHFASRQTMEVAVAQSFSKNFGLYSQRVGAFHLLAHENSVVPAIKSHIIRHIRSEYSSPPSWRPRIVETVLNDDSLKQQWLKDLTTMNRRIQSVRDELYSELQRLGTPGSWEHIKNQIGMFSYTGITAEQVKRLQEEYHIYLYSSGRASVAGLNSGNISYVAHAIDKVVRASPLK